MTKTTAKKQHYVPQFLLQNFALGKKRRLYIFDKKISKVYPSHVRDAAHENYFYKDDHLGYGTDTETKLAILEGKCAPIIFKIITTQSIEDLSNIEESLLCLFASVQMTRTNKTREFLRDFNEKLGNWFVESELDPNKDVENYKVQTESEIKSSSINILNTIPGGLADDFLDKKIALLKTPKGESFYISDNPIAMHNNFPRENRGNLGLRVKGVEVHFPISPRLCLIFMCNETISEIRNRVKKHSRMQSLGTAFPVDLSEAEALIESFDNKVTRVLSPENVEFHNSLQVIESSRFVYSKDSEFELAKDMLRTNPELAAPERFSIL